MWLNWLDFFFNFFFKKNDTADLQKEFDKVLELQQAVRQEYDDQHYIEKETEEFIVANDEQCTLSQGMMIVANVEFSLFVHFFTFSFQGKITSLNHEAGMLNREIPFSLSKAPNLHLSEGQTVSYLWYKKDDEQITICRIVEIIDENWNQPITVRSQSEFCYEKSFSYHSIPGRSH